MFGQVLSKTRSLPSARSHNKLLDALFAAGRMTSDNGFDAHNLPTGRHLIKLPDVEFPAIITGGTNPYSWMRATWGGPGAGWTVIEGSGGSESVGPAFEINSRTKVPAGYFALLRPGYQGDWRFQWLRMGSPPASGGGSVCLLKCCVASCSGAAIVGAVVKVLDSGGGTLATCTTDITGCCTLDVSTMGTYQLTATASGFLDYSHKITVTTCPQTFNIAMQPTGTSTSTVTFTVFGCCSQLLPNAMVTIDGQSGLTDSSGQVSFTITDVGTFPYNVTKSRFSPGSGEITVSSVCGSLDPGNNITLTLSPASGFTCAPLGNNATLADPTTTTLNLTDSQYGAAVVTFDGINSWTGTNTVSTSIGGGGLCPAGPVSVTITYTVSACPSADGSASATWSYHECGGCFGADCIANGGVMASDAGQVPCPQAGAALCAAGGVGTLNAGTSTETSVISPSVPLNLVVTFTAPASTALQLYSGTVTFTITE